ncbi:unnamed protein product [Tenebrio molitor]|jgi:lysosomal acid lipase/cholesteryl ester hydrolase|nr:unnamed protein product [Tenebrio molitor]
MHRIPHGKRRYRASKRVAFLMHGLFCSSACWIISGVDHALGYLLADQGYDVWMGNNRGNTYSLDHAIYSHHDREFWEYSWHEIGTIDVPSMIDYILEKTGQESLYYIGHSQGTTVFYVMTSIRPEYNSKITAEFSLSPVIYMDHIGPVSRGLALITPILKKLSELGNVKQLLPRSRLLYYIGRFLCGPRSFTHHLCIETYFMDVGKNWPELNTTFMPIFLGHFPDGASIKQFFHFSQVTNTGHFQAYDWGLDNNIFKYGSLEPPKYNLEAVRSPSYLFYSNNDLQANPMDVMRLCKELKNSCKGEILVANGTYNHADYLFGINAPKLVHTKLMKLMALFDASM